MSLHMLFSTVKENLVSISGFVLCCTACCVVASLGCIGFRCHILYVRFSGVGGNAEVGWGMLCMVTVMVVCAWCGCVGGGV